MYLTLYYLYIIHHFTHPFDNIYVLRKQKTKKITSIHQTIRTTTTMNKTPPRVRPSSTRLNIAEMKINDGTNSQLSISRSDRQDSGLYKCVAENAYGKSEHIIYLAVQGNWRKHKYIILFLFKWGRVQWVVYRRLQKECVLYLYSVNR